MSKVCPEGKELNPKTGRCIKIKTEKTAMSEKMTDIAKDIIENLKILQEYNKIHKNSFKAIAYGKAIDSIDMHDKPIRTIEDFKDIKGIGTQIHNKIEEYINTSKMDAVDKAVKDDKYILGKSLMNIYGVGPAKIDELFEKISHFDELYLDKNSSLLNDKQKIGLKYFKDLQTRIPYTEGKRHYKIIEKTLEKIHENIEFEMVGSYRRKCKDMGDIDILIKNNDNINLHDIVMNLKDSYILETLASGKNKFMGICRLSENLPARRIDILIAEPNYYYFALLYFTGSYQFNIYMRKMALQKGWSLSEYGIKDNKTKKFIENDSIKSINTEEDIFKILDVPYVFPNKR